MMFCTCTTENSSTETWVNIFSEGRISATGSNLKVLLSLGGFELLSAEHWAVGWRIMGFISCLLSCQLPPLYSSPLVLLLLCLYHLLIKHGEMKREETHRATVCDVISPCICMCWRTHCCWWKGMKISKCVQRETETEESCFTAGLLHCTST